jgi:hypothetical protein
MPSQSFDEPSSNTPTPPLSDCASVEELVQFFESHDMGTFLEQLPSADFQVGLKTRKFLVAVDESLVGRLAEVAQANRLTLEDLIDLWIREKLAGYGPR